MLEELQDLRPALAPLAQSLGLDTLAADGAAPPVAESVIQRCLADSQPCASVAERARLEESIGKARSALTVLGDADESDAAKALQARLLAEQAALDRLRKKAPSPELECAALEGAKAAYLQQAAARRAERWTFLDSLRTQLQKLGGELDKLEAIHAAAHADFAQQRRAAESEVVALLDSRIAAARSAAGASAAARPSAPMGVAAPGAGDAAVPRGAAPAPAPSSPELAELESQKALLDQQLQAARDRLAAVQAADASDADFARIVEAASLDALPNIQVPAGPQLEECGRWYQLINQWYQAGACVPFTFADITSAQCPPAEVLITAQLLLGSQWPLWFPGDAQVSPTTVLPRQLVCFLHQALDRLKCNCEKLEESRAAAATSYAMITASHKKRRAQVASRLVVALLFLIACCRIGEASHPGPALLDTYGEEWDFDAAVVEQSTHGDVAGPFPAPLGSDHAADAAPDGGSPWGEMEPQTVFPPLARLWMLSGISRRPSRRLPLSPRRPPRMVPGLPAGGRAAGPEGDPVPVCDAPVTASQLSLWRQAEHVTGLGPPTPASRRGPPPAAALDDAAFSPEAVTVRAHAFAGSHPGFYFGLAHGALGYHRDHGGAVPPAPVAADARAPPAAEVAIGSVHLWASGVWTIDTANANCWDTCLAQVIPRTSADALLIQEHKIHSELRLAAAARAAKQAGWRSHLGVAHSTACDRASGGVGVLCRRRFGMHPHADLVSDGMHHRLQAAHLGAVLKGGIHLCSIWLFHSQGISESNLHVLAEAAALLGTLSGPWVIAGDWNVAPQMLTDTGWQSAGWFAHGASMGSIPQGPLLPPAPGDWDSSPIVDASQLEAAIDNWYRAARGTFTLLTGVPAPWFRPYFRWEPAAGRPASRHAGASSIAVAWRDCSARAHETAAILGRPQPAAHDEFVLARHWSRVRAAAQRAARAPGDSPDDFHAWAAAFGHARITRGVSAARSLAAREARHAQRIEAAVAAARLAAYQSAWASPGGARSARTSASSPGRLAFWHVRGIGGWARSPAGDPRCEEDVPDADPLEYDDFDAGRVEVSPEDGHALAAAAPLSEQAALDREARGWADQWAVGEEYLEPRFPAHLLTEPQPLTAWSLDQAIASFPIGTGLGADHVAPRAILRLPSAARLRLSGILLAAERLGCWTAACNLVLIVLLPKPDGGLRPIGLFPTLIRIWMRARATAARAWEAARAPPSVFGCAGRGAQRAAWVAAFAAEASAASARHRVASLLDLATAFERVPRDLVAAAAARLDFDLAVLRLSPAAYRLARAIGVEGTFSCLLVAARGITAGSGFAAVELQMLLHETMFIATFRWPLLQLFLYVDDLTITASGFSEEALAAVSRGAEFFVDAFESCLRLTVSPTKSFAVASRPRLAAQLSLISKRRLLIPKRSVKLLGAPYAGGRAREAGVLRCRLKAMGSLSMLYGVDIVGASNTHLHSVRAAALRAVLPPGASWNVDVSFAELDAGGACLDPAHAAHATPWRHWGMAYWQAWAPAEELDAVFMQARDRLTNLLATSRSLWSAVAGPVAGVIATAWRLGWTCPAPRRFANDLGEPVGFLSMSPAMVAAAVQRSVGRWRTRRVVSTLSALVSGDPDMPLDQGAGAVTVLVGRPLAALVKGRGRPGSAVPQWSAPCRSQLLSAATGGQWPQVRLAKLRGAGVTDKACQLCGVTAGTLLHRRVCVASLPPDGWPEPPEVAVRWFTDPPDATRTDLCWYTDGSMKFGLLREFRRAGCAFVVVSEAGDLVAYGSAVPPPWIRTAAAAELWTVMLVLSITLTPPVIGTDCRALIATAEARSAQATKRTRMLVQIWSRVATLVDGDISTLVTTGRLTWMPAHGALTVIGAALRSDGHAVTAVDWRANRLADIVAEAAAGCPPPCGPASGLCGVAEKLVARECAVLGAVTHAANNRVRELVGPGGALRRVT
ncbi:unnamed protein product, partial [Prorocentrum cordatum]